MKEGENIFPIYHKTGDDKEAPLEKKSMVCIQRKLKQYTIETIEIF